jgi:hypothetical protein
MSTFQEPVTIAHFHLHVYIHLHLPTLCIISFFFVLQYQNHNNFAFYKNKNLLHAIYMFSVQAVKSLRKIVQSEAITIKGLN